MSLFCELFMKLACKWACAAAVPVSEPMTQKDDSNKHKIYFIEKKNPPSPQIAFCGQSVASQTRQNTEAAAPPAALVLGVVTSFLEVSV